MPAFVVVVFNGKFSSELTCENFCHVYQATASFRDALRYDQRHYNAWYVKLCICIYTCIRIYIYTDIWTDSVHI